MISQKFLTVYHRLRTRYYWPGMYRDVGEYASSCETEKVKYKQTSSQAPMRTRQPIEPWAIIATNVTGPFLRSIAGYQYVLNARTRRVHYFGLSKSPPHGR